jgi:hypothetical protein
MKGRFMKINELKIAVEKAGIIYKEIKDKYPKLKSHLVFSLPAGQCMLTDDPLVILNEFHKMIEDDINKENCLIIYKELELLKKKKPDNEVGKKRIIMNINLLTDDMDKIIDKLNFIDDVFIELRFDKLDYDIIYSLQTDPLISKEHTPQTHASIRIVLGKLKELV